MRIGHKVEVEMRRGNKDENLQQGDKTGNKEK